MTIVSLAIVMAQLWRASNAQRQEIARLRSELGYLTIDDKNMIYAKQIDVNQPDTRRIRMYLPKDKKFTLYFRTLTVPGRQPNQSKRDWLAVASKSRKRAGNQNIESGEHTFEVEIRRNPVRDGEIKGKLKGTESIPRRLFHRRTRF